MMRWTVSPVEINTPRGPSGRYRLACKSSDGGGLVGCCVCPLGHESARAAARCAEAQDMAGRITGRLGAGHGAW
jgi:hypothetical protein